MNLTIKKCERPLISEVINRWAKHWQWHHKYHSLNTYLIPSPSDIFRKRRKYDIYFIKPEITSPVLRQIGINLYQCKLSYLHLFSLCLQVMSHLLPMTKSLSYLKSTKLAVSSLVHLGVLFTSTSSDTHSTTNSWELIWSSFLKISRIVAEVSRVFFKTVSIGKEVEKSLISQPNFL